MDRIEYIEPSDAPEPEPEAAGPFAPRLRRAVLTLMAAIATHVWLIPPSGSDGHLPGLAVERSPVVAQSGLAMPSVLGMRGEPNREHPRKTTPPSVQVRTQFITLSASGFANRGTPPPSAIERPVGTSGFLRAAAAMPVARPAAVTPAETHPSPVQRPEVTESRAALTDVPARVETPELDAPVAGRAQTVSSDIVAIPVMADRAAEQKKTSVLRKADLTDEEEEEIVRRVLFDYKHAYDRLDVNSLKAIWPSLDDRKLRELQRAFRGLEGQELRFANCGVKVSGQDANARCQGDATYRPKVGSRVHLQEAEWTFSLARANDRWQIVKASLQ